MYQVRCDNKIIYDLRDEDLKIISPKLTTEINKTGTTRETLIDNELLYNIDSYNNSMYDAYSYGNKDLIYTKNNLIKDDEKILLLRDKERPEDYQMKERCIVLLNSFKNKKYDIKNILNTTNLSIEETINIIENTNQFIL